MSNGPTAFREVADSQQGLDPFSPPRYSASRRSSARLKSRAYFDHCISKSGALAARSRHAAGRAGKSTSARKSFVFDMEHKKQFYILLILTFAIMRTRFQRSHTNKKFPVFSANHFILVYL